MSYRATGALEGFTFVGVLVEVHSDHVVLTAMPDDAASRMRATREGRPVVAAEELR